MEIFGVEECRQFLTHKANYYSGGQKVLAFQPEKGIYIPVADIECKTYQHDVKLVKKCIRDLAKNYPKLNELLSQIKLYFCPFPNISFANAEVWSNDVVILYARTTQIPSVMTKYIIPHEFGHVVQGLLAHEYRGGQKVGLWREYLALRNAPGGICKVWSNENDEGFYVDKEDFYCLHRDSEGYPQNWDERPIEWFAEDFRFLFGAGKQSWELTTIQKPCLDIVDFIIRLGEEDKNGN